MLFTLGFLIVVWLGAILALIPVFIAIGAAGVAHAPVVAVLVGFVGLIGVIALVIWIMIRFSLVGPMTVDDGRFHLADAWRLSKGRAGALFLVGLCLFAVIVVVGVVQIALTLAFGGAQAQTLLATLQGQRAAASAYSLPAITPGLVVRYLISVPISGCLLAILSAPWARAYRDIARPDVATTFA